MYSIVLRHCSFNFLTFVSSYNWEEKLMKKITNYMPQISMAYSMPRQRMQEQFTKYLVAFPGQKWRTANAMRAYF